MNKLTTAVWEITMGCNMRCKHCGSSCAEALPDELNTSEALEVCDQLKDLGLKVITLSGGEPTTRSDWHIIAKRLVDNGIITSIITNGWLIDENFIHNAITSGIRSCLLYTSDAADDLLCVDLGGRRIIKKKNEQKTKT